jgi:glutamine synthetase
VFKVQCNMELKLIELADYIANGYEKEWALSKGVTHYTHWFQPCWNVAEAWCFETSYDGSDPVEKFGGAQVQQQEPDASVS